jgi:hypothetical protein
LTKNRSVFAVAVVVAVVVDLAILVLLAGLACHFVFVSWHMLLLLLL